MSIGLAYLTQQLYYCLSLKINHHNQDWAIIFIRFYYTKEDIHEAY
jgi:hypothetical protein